VRLFFAWRRRKSQNAKPAMIISAPTPTPTPIPTLAPVDRPLFPSDDVLPDPEPDVDVFVALDWVVEADPGPDVVVAETNKLESEAWSWIWIGCAHMVIGPET
jgi:hypothetical protein